jgi:hypothetical protein
VAGDAVGEAPREATGDAGDGAGDADGGVVADGDGDAPAAVVVGAAPAEGAPAVVTGANGVLGVQPRPVSSAAVEMIPPVMYSTRRIMSRRDIGPPLYSY